MAAIQKENTIVYFIQSKIQNPILGLLIWNFAIESINFSKGKEFNNGFDDWLSDVLLFFDIICTKEVPWEKSKGRQKCGTMEKIFNKKPVTFIIDDCQQMIYHFWNWWALLLLCPYINFDCTITIYV